MTPSSPLLPGPSPPRNHRRQSSVISILSPSRNPMSRLRPIVAILVLISLCCYLFSSSTTPISADYYTKLTSGYAPRPFRLKGFNPNLYAQLRKIQHRSLALRPVEQTFVKERAPEDEVPWKIEELLPPPRDRWFGWLPKSLGGSSGLDGYEGIGMIRGMDSEPLPVHSIDAFPRKVDLTRGQGGVGQDLTTVDRMMFGLVTTAARAKRMSELWAPWLVPSDPNQDAPACLILLSKEENRTDIEDLESVLKSRRLPCVVKQSPHERYEVRVLSMIREMKEYSDSLDRTIDWFVFGDDDTLWLDIRATLRMLSKYDLHQEWFVGTQSEGVEAMGMFGRMAYGGAGIFASAPLMSNMANRWDECYDNFRTAFGGDEMLTRCAGLAKGVDKDDVTTQERGLHQFDIPGDTTGALQAGWQIHSLHHYLGGGWAHLFGYGTNHTDFEQIKIIQKVGLFLGGDNMFKRYVFGDGKWLLVNGYSITYFEEPLTRKDLLTLEHTWYIDYPLILEDRPPVPERHGEKPAKQTFYIDGIETISAQSAVFTYLQADSWDENMELNRRVQLQVLWDGDHTTHAESLKPE
ncbi:hypothetical protein JCM5353_004238 [Sporobolomyces roseus]